MTAFSRPQIDIALLRYGIVLSELYRHADSPPTNDERLNRAWVLWKKLQLFATLYPWRR
jgi:hypothetical protein